MDRPDSEPLPQHFAPRDPNPYAAPTADAPLPVRAAQLPAGFRRFRLDPVAYGPYMRRIVLRRFLVLLVIVVVFQSGFSVLAGASGATWGLSVLGVAFFVGMALLNAFGSRGRAELQSYELILAPRLVRRVSQIQPAEILRPEVTRIVEVPEGLWLSSAAPRRFLFIARAIDGYADVRAELAGWRAIETERGWAAWRTSSAGAKAQGSRDAILGTALASDASLVEELELARAVSTAPYRQIEAPKRSFVGRGIVLWFLLIAMFLAIWNFLSPPVPQGPGKPTRTNSSSK